MLNISRIRPCENNKVVVSFTMNPAKLVLHFSEFSTIFTNFTSFCKWGFTIADPLYVDTPGKKYTLTDKSLVCTKLPAKKSGVAIGSLAVGGGGLAGIRWLRRISRPGNSV
jgi:hypothetical protein